MLPHIYIRLTSNYSFALTALALILPVPTFIISGIFSYGFKNVYNQDEQCILQQALSEQMFIALRGIRIGATLLGVLLYIIVAKRIYKILKPSNDIRVFNATNRKRIFSMTTTFLMITINQLILFILPDIVILLLPKATSSLSFIFYVMNMNKGIVNIIIFVLTQRELRRAIAKKLWNAASTQLFAFTEKNSTTKIQQNINNSNKHAMTTIY
uniref:G-protein coupled receptors family 1 profile domain-containing protein n=1 Tax=Panagrolaimus sp. PS1159 TaxID=55785 RepID=A0AC35GSZ0_9BILA